jgi:hypothetical protein
MNTHCCHGHEMTPEITYRNPRGHIECTTCRNAANRTHRGRNIAKGLGAHSGKVSLSTLNMLMEALHAGQPVAKIVGRKSYPPSGKIICHGMLTAFRRANPALNKTITKLITRNIAAELSSRCKLIVAPAIIRSTGSLMDAIARAVPLHLAGDHRDDAIQNIWMAVLEGRVKPHEIAGRAQEFVRSEYRTSHNVWGPRSLDMPLFHDSTATLGDTITRGLWD